MRNDTMVFKIKAVLVEKNELVRFRKGAGRFILATNTRLFGRVEGSNYLQSSKRQILHKNMALDILLDWK